jgi:hypothetical protein
VTPSDDQRPRALTAHEEAAALGKEGLDLAIIVLPPPYDPAVLEPLAHELSASGLLDSKFQ